MFFIPSILNLSPECQNTTNQVLSPNSTGNSKAINFELKGLSILRHIFFNLRLSKYHYFFEYNFFKYPIVQKFGKNNNKLYQTGPNRSCPFGPTQTLELRFSKWVLGSNFKRPCVDEGFGFQTFIFYFLLNRFQTLSLGKHDLIIHFKLPTYLYYYYFFMDIKTRISYTPNK